MQVASNPLFIEDLVGNSNEIRRGAAGFRRIRVKNLGERTAEIDIWIVATNSKSEPLLRWCTFSEQNPLKIDAKNELEVILNFQVPTHATPDTYNYEILIEAATQYPGKIFRRPQQLRILPSEQDAEWGNEPGFSIIAPITNSTNPLPLQAGEQLEVKVRVENRSKRVDRFYLNCPELIREWYSVRYPEMSFDVPGLIKETDGLELNPGATGEISLILHPPQYTLAGNYFPTIRLVSSNREDLVLLDVVYLQIIPDDSLYVEMRPPERKVPQEVGEFEIELTNQGNIQREIAIRAKDAEELFSYIMQPNVVLLPPGETQIVTLRVKPRKWWHRHWRSKGLLFTFDIELENTGVAAPDELISALPKNLPQGKLLWESHPWWMLWLLILLGLGTVGVLAFTIWWNLLREKIPPPTPKVTKFEATAKSYQEGKDDAIRLNWEISHLKQVEKVTVTRLEGNIETDRKNYLFADGIPQELQLANQKKNGSCEAKNVNRKSSIDKEKSLSNKPSWNSIMPDRMAFIFPMKKNANASTDILSCKGIITGVPSSNQFPSAEPSSDNLPDKQAPIEFPPLAN
jgi:hypothetical protein